MEQRMTTKFVTVAGQSTGKTNIRQLTLQDPHMTLELCLKALDRLCATKFGVFWSDMPDLTFVSDLFEDGMTVEQVLDECAEAWADDDPMFASLMAD